jgi:NADPH:quinone reductase
VRSVVVAMVRVSGTRMKGNLTIRLLGSDDFPAEAKDAAARDLTTAAARSALAVPVAEVIPLARIAAAHDLIESGRAQGRVLISLP